MKIRLAFLFVLAALSPVCASAQWSPDSMLSTLTLREQIGQLLMPPVYSHPGKVNWEEAEGWVRTDGIGGVICMQGGPELQKERIARLQAEAKVPLWTASDAEWGLGMRLDSTRSWPRAMTLGAANDTALTRSIAQEMGRELRSVGIHVNFAPVVDVNSNPSNPVIGNRSFGESVARVSEQGVAFAQGLQDVGILATAKHFPGHGDTDADSHMTLPTIAHSRSRLDSVELEPFRALTAAGVGAMMAAHLYIPSLDSTPGQPSTLSPAIVSDLLRGEIGFDGIVFTDAMTMKGFEDFATTETPHVDALLAGNDVLLFPGPPAEVLVEILSAVESGRVDSAFIAQKCLRVLQAKSHWSRPLPFNTNPDRAEQLHRHVVARALTVLINRQRALPIKPEARDIAVVHVQSKGEPDWFSANLGRILGNAYNIQSHEVPEVELATTGYNVLSELEASPPNWIFLNIRDLNSRASKGWGLSDASIGWMELLAAKFAGTPTKVGVIINGSPYLLGPLERLSVLSDALIVAYQDDQRTQEALASAIAGAGPAMGKLPVGAGGFEIGAGKPMLGRERLGFSPVRWEGSARIDSVVQLALDAGAMPGCRVVVAHKGKVIHNESYGTTDGKAEVNSETIYDLASITKVFASTLSLMWLEERGFLHRTDRLAAHLPELTNTELGDRTFEQILSHTAGLTPWIPFYVEAMETPEVFVERRDATHNLEVADGLWMADAYRDSIWTRIVEEPLAQPGKERYSDLGYYLMQRVIERLTEQPLDAFVADAFYAPLALHSTTYRPAERFDLERIAPTENDMVFRRQTIHGHVHDPGAAMLGGVAGHAGLFSDALDCARLMQMMINGGIYGRHHVFQAATVKSWTDRVSAREGCRKACGWDKPAEEPSVGSCCDEAGWGSFGHSGFTGTLVWGDPDAELVYVFLSNRVHPDAENWKLVRMNTRTEVQRVIYESLGIPGRFAPSASS